MRSNSRSLVRRVAFTAAAAAITASAATLVVVLVASDRRAISNAQRDALSSARAVLEEIPADADEAEIERQLREEVEEVVPRRFSAAVYDRGRRVAGSDVLPARWVGSAGCRFVPGSGGEWLLCVAVDASNGHSVVTGLARERVLSHRGSLVSGGLIALLLVGLAAVLGGGLVARLSLRPLVRLREALERFPAAGGTSAANQLLPRSELAEIDIVVVTLQQLLQQLDSELQRARRFAADAAHELRTPLTKIQAELELMAEGSDAGSEQAHCATRLLARARDLGVLVERLLVLASPVASLRPRSLVSLSAGVEVEVAASEHSGRIRVNLEDDGLVRGDASLLASVVSNAIGNALKFSDGPVDVTVCATPEEIVLRVDDQGPGVGAEVRERAFDGFYRAAEHRSRPGYGIGLALIAHVVAAHDGTCAFVGEEPGAHLEIRLPKHIPSAD